MNQDLQQGRHFPHLSSMNVYHSLFGKLLQVLLVAHGLLGSLQKPPHLNDLYHHQHHLQVLLACFQESKNYEFRQMMLLGLLHQNTLLPHKEESKYPLSPPLHQQ
uniref:Uncharacterized protein n=1 Tax=Opuntia streptacantha TaxID=393608 RepID=A0A7C9EP55_OPUST